jgi:hypothetical protein
VLRGLRKDIKRLGLKNLGHKDDPWMLADRVAQVFYILDPETRKHIVVSRK